LPPKQSSDYQVEVGGKIRLARSSCARCSAQYKQATSRQRPQVPAGKMPEPSADPIADYGAADSAPHDETDKRILAGTGGLDEQMPRDERPTCPAPASRRRGEVSPPPHPRRSGKHGRHHLPAASDADARAALPAPRGQDCATGPGAHAQPEAMSLRPTAVIRLKRTLTHWNSRSGMFAGNQAISTTVATGIRP